MNVQVGRDMEHYGVRFPCIVYGHSLDAHDIETAARAGALWLELAPADGARLLAAARGLVAAARQQASA